MRRLPLIPLLALLVTGCEPATKNDGRVPVYSVEGRLVVGDRPAANAQIAFHPVAGGPHRSVAVTGPDGGFRLTTHAAGDGAPAGEYVVTVFWENEADPLDGCVCPDPTSHDRLGGLYYNSTTSALRATVKPEENEIVLRAEVGGRGWNLPRLRPKK